MKLSAILSCFSPQSPLPEQEAPSAGLMSSFELMSSKDVAYHMTAYDWELFHCVHEVRPTYQVFRLRSAEHLLESN